jgi:hypothetical protein
MANRSLGTLTVDLIAKTAGFEQGMDRAARLADRRSKDISKAIDRGLKGAVGSVAAFTAGLVGGLLSAQAAFEGFMNAINNADRLDELSARLGISTEQLSEWGYAAKLSGTDLESLTGSIQKFSKTVAAAADANSRQAELFASLGISVKDAAGNLRDVEDLLPEVADRFKALDNETTETALAMELFGRSGAELLEFLNRGSDGLNKLGDEARNLGGVIDGETAKAAAEFKDELDRLRVVTNALFTQIARELLPDLKALTAQFISAGKGADGLASQVRVVVDLLKTGFEISGLNALLEVVSRLRSGFAATAEAARGLANLDFSRIRNAYNQGQSAFFGSNQQPAAGSGRARNARGGSNRPETGGLASDLQQSVNRFLQNQDDGSKKAAGSTRKVRTEVDQLKVSYDNLSASLSEQIALFGQTTEVAKLRYDLENGELAKLNPAQKEYLIGLAEQLDAKRRLADLQEAADEAVKRESEAFEENRKANKGLIADMQFELDLLKMTNEERNRAIALRYLSADASEEEKKKVLDLADAQVKAAESAELWDGIQRSLADGLFDAITGAESLTDAVRNFFDEVANMLLRQTLEKLSQQITDAFQASANSGQSGGGWGAAIANFFSTAFGGARANGGPVQAGVPYLVGERGPELFVAPKTGTIIPNNKMGMGLTQVNNFMVQGRMDRRTEDQIASDVGRKSSTALRRNS